MTKRWSIPFATAAIALGTLLGLTGNASAAAVAHHPSVTAVRPGGVTAPAFRPGGLMKRPTGATARAAVHGRSFQAESTNWSGYAATGANGAFNTVSASWTEPTATCSSGKHNAAAPPSTPRSGSAWTATTATPSSRPAPTRTVTAAHRTTTAGTRCIRPTRCTSPTPLSLATAISASVTFSGTETYTLVLKDATQGWTQTITKNQSGLDRSSAEVITEAPSSNSGVLPLADFGTVTYGSSIANGTSLGSESPTEIIMVDNSGADKDSTSSINGSGGFSNTWLRAS